MPSPASRASHDSPNSPVTADGWRADPPKVVYETAGLVASQWKNVAIHLWTGAVSLGTVGKLDELSPAFARAHPRGFSSVHIIAQGMPLPDREVRQALRNLTNKHAKNIACVCHVVEGAGFWAGALHSFLTGFHFGPREPFELSICSTLDAAAQRLPAAHSRRTGVFVTTGELETALRAVRSRLV